MSIVVGCLVTHADSAKACASTWIPQCGMNVELLCPSNVNVGDLSVTTYDPGEDSPVHSALLTLMMNHEVDYYLLCTDQNYLNGDNLTYLVRKYKPEEAFLVSGYSQIAKVGNKAQVYPIGSSGILLTRTALKRLSSLLPKIRNEWSNLVEDKLVHAWDLALAYYAEQCNIVICRDYGLHCTNWLGDTPYGRINEGDVHYDRVVTFSHMNSEQLRRYHRYQHVVPSYYLLAILCLQHRDSGAYQRGRDLKRAIFTPADSIALMCNTVKGMVDSLDHGLVVTGTLPDTLRKLASELMLRVE